MVQLVCHCLNIRIHGKGVTAQLQNTRNLKLSANAISDHFFASDVGLYHVFLDLGGVTKAQKLLCSSRCVDGWVITTCTGCDLDFYAKYIDDNDDVFVTSTAEIEPSRITSLMESDSYSVLFKMILPEINDNYIQNNIGIELSSGNLDHTVEYVQNQVSHFLKEEQKSMEEQIRQFTEQAHLKFAALQQKVRRHKQAMVYLLIKAKGDKQCPVLEPMAESPLASPLSSFRHSCNDMSSSTDSTLQRQLSDQHIETKVQVQVKALRKPISYPTSKLKSSRKLNYAAHSIDIGDVFEMEGFDANRDTASFYNSDDETDENSAAEDSFILNRYHNQVQCHAYATSLPMSVPAFSSFSHISAVEEDKVGDPSQMAASIKALAQSVHDGTEMFGDLPRRRLNTGDLLQSRPM